MPLLKLHGAWALARLARLAMVTMVAMVATLAAAPVGATGITVQPWGVTGTGVPVERVTLQNNLGMRLSLIDYGATMVEADVADRHGKRANVILGLPDLPAYEATRSRHAAIIGRYAGRIGGARYTLDGVTVQLIPNKNGIAIHGDPAPYDKRVWRRQDFADASSIGAIYRLHSPAGDQNFPGAIDITVTYRLLRRRDEFRIEYAVSTDAPTVLNLTNHAYLNLAGAAAGPAALERHLLRIAADRYVVTDAKRVPTGELADVAGTPLDFRHGASLAPGLRNAATTPLMAPAGGLPGYDHSLVFSKPAGRLATVATIDDPASGRRLDIATSEPSVQLYSASAFDGREIGAEGVGYQHFGAFAFETQHLPDSPNHAGFPSTALYPGRPFHSVTIYRFSAH